MWQVLIKVSKDWEKTKQQEITRVKKAAQVALTKTTYDLYDSAREALKHGQLDLPKKSPYRNEQNDPRYKLSIRDTVPPLATLYKGITYKVDKNNLTAKYGFLGLSAGTVWQEQIADKSLPGYEILIKPRASEYLHTRGIHLRASTTSTNVPSRDPIGAIFNKHKYLVLQKYKNYFERKMAGEQI
jgi:hypothetical protein